MRPYWPKLATKIHYKGTENMTTSAFYNYCVFVYCTEASFH